MLPRSASRAGFVVALLLLVAGVVFYATRGDPAATPPTHVDHGPKPAPIATPTPGGAPTPDARIEAPPPDVVASGDEAPAELGERDGFFGHVRSRPSSALADVELTFALERADGSLEALGTTRSARDGRYTFALPTSARGSWVRVSARPRGNQPLAERRRVALDAPNTAGGKLQQRWDLYAMPGESLTARAVDAHGAPVAGAQAQLIVLGKRGTSDVESVAASVESASDGRFELGFTSSGTYWLRVRALGVGCAARGPLELVAGRGEPLGDLVLHGEGRIAGSALHPDGSAAPFLELWAVPAELAARGDAHALAVTREQRTERDDGLVWTRAQSDANGRFELVGLRPGSYAVVSPRPEMHIDAKASVFSTPEENARVVVPTARLAVRVVDARGTPISRARVACGRMEPDSDGSFEIVGERWEALRPGSARIEFALEPDRAYALRAQFEKRSVEDVVQLAPGQFELERTLTLPDEEALGRLRVLATFAGAPARDVRVSFFSAVTGERIAELIDLAPDASGVVGPIPPGRYEIEVVAQPDASLASLAPPLPLRLRDPIAIPPGGLASVDVALLAGATLELTLTLDGAPPTDFEFRAKGDEVKSALEAARAEHERVHGATLRLTPVGADASASRMLAFDVPAPREGLPPLVESTLLPGKRANVHGALQPGAFVARVEAPGFEPFEATLTLVASAHATLDVALRAKR